MESSRRESREEAKNLLTESGKMSRKENPTEPLGSRPKVGDERAG